MEMPLKNTGKVLSLAWDKDGDSVAILQVILIFLIFYFGILILNFLKFKFKFREITQLWFGIQVPKA